MQHYLLWRPPVNKEATKVTFIIDVKMKKCDGCMLFVKLSKQ